MTCLGRPPFPLTFHDVTETAGIEPPDAFESLLQQVINLLVNGPISSSNRTQLLLETPDICLIHSGNT